MRASRSGGFYRADRAPCAPQRGCMHAVATARGAHRLARAQHQAPRCRGVVSAPAGWRQLVWPPSSPKAPASARRHPPAGTIAAPAAAAATAASAAPPVPRHLVVMVNGLTGAPGNWDYLCGCLEELPPHVSRDLLLHRWVAVCVWGAAAGVKGGGEVWAWPWASG